MKRILLVFCAVTLFILSSAIFIRKYVVFDIADDEIYLLNPIAITQDDYEKTVKLFITAKQEKNLIGIQESAKKNLRFRNTHNERVQEYLHSSAVGLYDYKLDKVLIYSECYELLGESDSALSVLKPFLKYSLTSSAIQDRFFKLATRKYGSNKVVDEINKGLHKIEKLDCYFCDNVAYTFMDAKVGITKEHSESLQETSAFYKELVYQEDYYKRLLGNKTK